MNRSELLKLIDDDKPWDVKDVDFPFCVRHFEKLDFSVLAIPQEHMVDYIIYDLVDINADNHEDRYYPRLGNIGSGDTVNYFGGAEAYISGSVKWDGCSNWEFNEQKRVMLHGCSKEGIVRYGLILGECWDLTGELCAAFKKYTGEES